MAARKLHPHGDECGEEAGENCDRGILDSTALRAFDQRISRRNQPDTMQLGSEAVFVSGSGGSREALAQLCDFFCASAAAANFRTTAGCGHKVLLGNG